MTDCRNQRKPVSVWRRTTCPHENFDGTQNNLHLTPMRVGGLGEGRLMRKNADFSPSAVCCVRIGGPQHFRRNLPQKR